MKNTEKDIIKGALEVFLDKGFLQATTQEIAKKAGVAEVTLFRKYKNKQALFERAITSVLDDIFDASNVTEIYRLETPLFYRTLLKNRIEVIQQHKDLFKLLISESIRNHLPKDLQFTEVVFKQLKQLLDFHYIYHHQQADTDIKARIVAGFLLGEAILPESLFTLDHLEAYIEAIINA